MVQVKEEGVELKVSFHKFIPLEPLSKDELKERNRKRAQLTRKRKKSFYTDLEVKYQNLEEENRRLSALLEN